ncbi:uncharacterized protein yc1106_04307 [Curvularia clavata]|uniref:Uncharacterized protein n=1 Tax=Curvularia clavata TaxID=95742 RepID=A0A9Q9DR32_CURCL|nr:uncharacterized protein yc1106_04307 [Curvularia clavata]
MEPTSSRPPGGELRQETRRTPICRPREGKDRSPSPRPVPSEWLTASQNAEVLRQWEQRHGVNTMPSHSWLPSRMQSSPRPLSPPRGPIRPGTEEWDKFMGFPLDNAQYVHRGLSSKKSVEITAASEVPVSSEPAAVTEMEPALVSRDVDSLPQVQPESLISPGQASLKAKPPGISPSEAEPTPALTWTSALNSILYNEAVDPEIRAAITERSQHNSSNKRAGHREALPVELADANLVPNFSYPIASSVFYEHVDAAPAPPMGSFQEEDHEEDHEEEQLSDGVRVNHYSYAGSNDTLYRDPTPPSWPLRWRDEDHTPARNGAPQDYYLRSSSDESSDASSNTRQRSPLTRSLVPEQVSAMLRSTLTPSELSLHFQVVQEKTAVDASPYPGHESAYNARPPAPPHVRLIRKLDTALHGLQDRIAGLEETLIPQLSGWLEQKNRLICEQDVEISRLIDEIIELKHITDFGNSILSRCRERELEVWHTLLDIQRKHQEKRGSVVRMFSRARPSVARDTEGGGCGTPGDYAAEAPSSASANKHSLRKKELDALLLVAKQNVNVVDEDVAEMAERLQAYLARSNGTEGSERPIQGSWRDV